MSLRRKFRDWLFDDQPNKVSAVETYSPDCEPILNFRIYSASNGQILEFRKYDRKNDRMNSSLYIVEPERDLGEYVAKVISLELMK
jgi:hypothetical protein